MDFLRCLLFAIACLTASPLVANNNYFLPGDACFPTEITAEVLDKLKTAKPGEFPFRYSDFGVYGGGFFCGHAGYANAKLPAVDRPFVANLAKVYAEIRITYRKELVEFDDDGKTDLREKNGIRVIFYPQAFEFPRYKVGLRYNEKWVDEIVKFGHDAEHIRLGELVDDKDAIIESWRNSTRVGTFDVLLPTVELDSSSRIEEPVTIKGDIKAIVIPPIPLSEFYQPQKPRYAPMTVYVVDSEGITPYEFDNGKWTKVRRDEE